MIDEVFKLIAESLDDRSLDSHLEASEPMVLDGPKVLSNTQSCVLRFSKPTFIFTIGDAAVLQVQEKHVVTSSDDALIVAQMQSVDVKVLKPDELAVFALPLSFLSALMFVTDEEFKSFENNGGFRHAKLESTKTKFDLHIRECAALLLSSHIANGPNAPRTCILDDEFYAAFASTIGPAALLNAVRDPNIHPCVAEAVQYVNQNIGKPFGLQDLLNACSAKSATLFEGFKRDLGQTPGKYIRQARIRAAQKMLSLGDDYVSQVGYNVGYRSHAHFCRDFRGLTTLTPSEWRDEYLESGYALDETG